MLNMFTLRQNKTNKQKECIIGIDILNIRKNLYIVFGPVKWDYYNGKGQVETITAASI